MPTQPNILVNIGHSLMKCVGAMTPGLCISLMILGELLKQEKAQQQIDFYPFPAHKGAAQIISAGLGIRIANACAHML